MPIWITPTIIRYAGIAVTILTLLLGVYAKGRHDVQVKFNAYKMEQQKQARIKEQEHQAATDQIRKEKDAEIVAINSKLVDAISELRKRPARPAQVTNNGQSGTGATLYAEDAEFLIREAARADVIRTALNACYLQYDAIAK